MMALSLLHFLLKFVLRPTLMRGIYVYVVPTVSSSSHPNFKYLPESHRPRTSSSFSVQPTYVPEDHAMTPETSEEDPNNGAEVCNPSDNDSSVVEDEVVAEPPAYPSQSENVAVESLPFVPEGDAPKKSYASIVKYRKANPTPTKAHASTNDTRVAPSNSEQQSREPAKPALVPDPIVSTVETAPESNNVQDEGCRKPGLLLSTMRALDSVGLDVQQAVISYFNGFSMDIFRAEADLGSLDRVVLIKIMVVIEAPKDPLF